MDGLLSVNETSCVCSWQLPKLGSCLSMESWTHVSGVFSDHIQLLRDIFEL